MIGAIKAYLTAIEVAAGLCLLVLVGIVSHNVGENSQKVANQAQFDKINAGLTKQRDEANTLLAGAIVDRDKARAESDALKAKLETQRVQDTAATDAARARLAPVRLRFIPDQAGANRPSGSASAASEGNAASATQAGAVELSAAAGRFLRDLTLESDRLADAYRECYGWVNR